MHLRKLATPFSFEYEAEEAAGTMPAIDAFGMDWEVGMKEFVHDRGRVSAGLWLLVFRWVMPSRLAVDVWAVPGADAVVLECCDATVINVVSSSVLKLPAEPIDLEIC
jgi:hypothetical protein